MPLDEDRSALSKYRLEKAEKNLKAAKLLFENKLLSESINRSYYSFFHIEKEYSKIISKAFKIRTDSDYRVNRSIALAKTTGLKFPR